MCYNCPSGDIRVTFVHPLYATWRDAWLPRRRKGVDRVFHARLQAPSVDESGLTACS